MNIRLIAAGSILCLCICAPFSASGHPTNGHLCTEIQTPTRCFNSDGFCEWVFARCLYRCDLHDTAPDCEDIKDGCAWDGEACRQSPSDFDSGVPQLDADVVDSSEDTLEPSDSSVSDSTTADLDARPATISLDMHPRDINDAALSPAEQNQPHAGCNSNPSHSSGWALTTLLLFIIRIRS